MVRLSRRYIPHIYIVNSHLHGCLSRLLQEGDGRGGKVGQLVPWIEAGEMEGIIGPQIFEDQ